MVCNLDLCQGRGQQMGSLWYDRCRRFCEKKRPLYYAFVDLEKAFDRIQRDMVRWALRKLEVEEWLMKAVMIMYKRAKTMVKMKHGNSKEFEGKVQVHQGSVLNTLQFVVVMEALMQDSNEGLPWELLYANNLVLMADSIEELKGEVLWWKGFKMNIGKTKVVMSKDRGSGHVRYVQRVLEAILSDVQDAVFGYTRDAQV